MLIYIPVILHGEQVSVWFHQLINIDRALALCVKCQKDQISDGQGLLSEGAHNLSEMSNSSEGRKGKIILTG